MKQELHRYVAVTVLAGLECFATQAESSANLRGALQGGLVIAADLQHVAAFVQVLERAGLTVRDVQHTSLEGMFKGPVRAAFITTNRGVVEAAIFSGPMDAERISITYRRDPDVPTVSHLYRIEGWPINGEAGSWHAAYPVYFTLHRNWFIVTHDPEVDPFLKRALGQSRPRRDQE
jgi:hypothetical protein